jgi:hypothetical protein
LLPFRSGRGGARSGAGRKPKVTGRPGVDHRERAPLAKRFPVHVTIKLQQRSAAPAQPPRIRRTACGVRGRLRPQPRRHLPPLPLRSPERPPAPALRGRRPQQLSSRGLQGLLIRVAKALNKLWARRGSVFADRYHDHILKSPREVRNALRYLFGNFKFGSGKKHAAEGREVRVAQALDTFTSAPWFQGFRERITVVGIEAIVRPVADARTWLLSEGWLRHGRIGVHEMPATA